MSGHARPPIVMAELREQLRAAIAARTPLRIIGGDTKRNWWQTSATSTLALEALRGIVTYEPSELVITAYAGTRLTDIQLALAERRQMLGFEPPETGLASTLGGTIVAGLSGPSRPYRGSVRDFVLGVRLLSNDAEPLRFGGQVMKNVAGYDVSRLVTGSWGRLGPLTEISLRVIPIPQETISLAWPSEPQQAHQQMLALGRRALPLTGLCFDGSRVRMRLAGAAHAVAAARASLPEATAEDPSVWASWRDLTHPYFASARSLWRLSVPPAAKIAEFGIPPPALWDWGGALRWQDSDLSQIRITTLATAAGGFAQAWPPRANVALAPLGGLEARVRHAFDSSNIFNPV